MRRLAVLWVVFILLLSSAYADMTVTFIDVGQGDSALIQADGEVMLIDAGPNASSGKLLSLLQAVVTTIDKVVITHPHEDHIGGMDEVINNFLVRDLFMPDATTTTKTFTKLLDTIENHNLEINVPEVGDSFTLGKATVTVLAPNSSQYTDINNYSIVLRIEYGTKTFLLTGDAEFISEREMLNAGANLRADVLKVGHHGSASSTSPEFFAAVSPAFAVISCGTGNTYGHPANATLETLFNTTVLRTDLLGTIEFTTDGEFLWCYIQTSASSMYGLNIPTYTVIRSAPSVSSAVVSTIVKSGSVFQIEHTVVNAEGETWYYIQYADIMGYIRGDLVRAVSAGEAKALQAAASTPKPTLYPSPLPTDEIRPAPASTLVWLSATGVKYHRINNCGNMNPQKNAGGYS